MLSSDQNERTHVGCQGWNYEGWITPPAARAAVFYPHGTRPADMLTLYARAFETVEVDSTFYAVPSVSTIDGWAKRAPAHFTFALKLPQEITHEYELRRGGFDALQQFCERARQLEAKLGAVLIQLPPHFEATPENSRALHEFLPRLPRDVRFSVEFRHSSWLQESVFAQLAQHHVALALVEGQWITRARTRRLIEEAVTADFAYIRFMGARDLTRFDTVQRAQAENLQQWSEAIARLSTHVSQIYVYFSNYYEGHAPLSANALKQLLGQSITIADDLEDQPSLF